MSSFIKILLLYACVIVTFSTFDDKPAPSFPADPNAEAVSVKISGQEDIIAVGFNDGMAKLYDFSGNEICQMTASSDPQILQVVWAPSFGPITLDSNSTITLFDSDCNLTNKFQFSQNITRMAWLQQGTDNVNGTIAFNFQDRIESYDLITNEFKVTYKPQDNQSFLDLIYVTGSDQTNYLVASTSGSFVRIYYAEDGNETEMSFETNSPIKELAKISGLSEEQVMGLTESNYIYRFDVSGKVLKLGPYVPTREMTLCPTTKQIILAEKDEKHIGVYLFGGFEQQVLTSSPGYVVDMECSDKYLVAVDDEGNVNVYMYSKFKSWVIGLIAGIVGGLLFLVILTLVIIRLRKKWAQEEASKDKFDSQKPKKYSKYKNNSPTKTQSMKMLSTFETTMNQA